MGFTFFPVQDPVAVGAQGDALLDLLHRRCKLVVLDQEMDRLLVRPIHMVEINDYTAGARPRANTPSAIHALQAIHHSGEWCNEWCGVTSGVLSESGPYAKVYYRKCYINTMGWKKKGVGRGDYTPQYSTFLMVHIAHIY